MAMRAAAAAAALALGVGVVVGEAPAAAAARAGDAGAAGPRPLEPVRSIKPAAGYFDDAFGLGAGGRTVAVVRTDGSTFAKLELLDTDSGATRASFDLPGPAAAASIEQIEVLPDDRGVLLITREAAARPFDPEEPARVSLALVDAAGRVAARVGPAAAFGFPSRAPAPLLVAFDRKPAGGGVTVYTIAPFDPVTLAPAGKARVYRASAEGDVTTPPFRIAGFGDGYAQAVGERPGGRLATLDTLTGKVTDEAEDVDPLAWLRAARLRAEHPGQGRFAALNPAQAGVDIVDAMGNIEPATLAVPFSRYDPRSLRGEEGPERGTFHFSLAIDTLNADAVKRRKPDLPMLDVYAAARGKRRAGAPADKLEARVFVPRAVTWRAGWGKLVLLKRLKNVRGGDELQIFELR
jgi:hypothetical protein